MALVTVPFDAQLTGISCTSVTGCAVVGSSGQSFVTGWWNGRTLAVYRLALPHGVSNQLDEIAVSCWRAGSCIVVRGGHEDGVAAVARHDLDHDMILADLPYEREQVLACMAYAHCRHKNSPHSYRKPVQV
jgi:hypothetical protein